MMDASNERGRGGSSLLRPVAIRTLLLASVHCRADAALSLLDSVSAFVLHCR